ncbi:hypothetical protein, partial [Salmonella enterica]|nr:hypothetical protein [Salmonella enterica]
ARALALAEVAPARIDWQIGEEASGLFAGLAEPPPVPANGAELRVPREFVELAQAVVCHRDSGRFDLLYRLLLRLQREPTLLHVVTDDEVHS